MTVVFNEVAAVLNGMLRQDPVRDVIRIRPDPVKRSGRRARRDAFYHRARLCRVLTRIAKAGLAEQSEELQMRVRNAIVRGTSHPEFIDTTQDWVWPPRLSAEAEAALAAGLPIGRDGEPADPEKFGVIAIDSAQEKAA
jgi:hypothetical protein